MLDQHGKVKLIDFGLSAILEKKKKTFTFAGSPEYMAPEIINRIGHSYEADLWSLGVLIYELTEGTSPFYSEGSIYEI